MRISGRGVFAGGYLPLSILCGAPRLDRATGELSRLCEWMVRMAARRGVSRAMAVTTPSSLLQEVAILTPWITERIAPAPRLSVDHMGYGRALDLALSR